jgi:hypothetical protein
MNHCVRQFAPTQAGIYFGQLPERKLNVCQQLEWEMIREVASRAARVDGQAE